MVVFRLFRGFVPAPPSCESSVEIQRASCEIVEPGNSGNDHAYVEAERGQGFYQSDMQVVLKKISSDKALPNFLRKL